MFTTVPNFHFCWHT